MPFFILFLFIPILEISVFVTIGAEIGLFTTLLLAVFTAILGSAIIRHQGLQALSGARESLNQGALPAQEIFDGFCLVAAGALLITPGFVTDTIGFLLLVPALRTKARSVIGQYFKLETVFSSDQKSKTYHDPDVIDGEYETIDIDQKTP